MQLGSATPQVLTLVAAEGAQPAVNVTFRVQPSPTSLRAGRQAVAKVLQAGGPRADERAGWAFTEEIVRWNMMAWDGIFDGDRPLQPAHDVLNSDGEVEELGTISAFLADPRLMEAADRLYVMPWAMRDAEKNGLSPSPDGTSERATPASDIANSAAAAPATGDATSAPMKPKRRGRTKV